ncbi:MAG TPA: hypothetical protein V6D28_14765 [Leptolyngbyaceae cyanobacterium]
MPNSNGNSRLPPNSHHKNLIISLISLIFFGLEILFRIFKCYLGEFYSLFWINFAFLIFLFYWPTYFSANPAIGQPISQRERYRIFLTALLRAIFYLICFSILLVIILFFLKKGISDTLQFLPLLLFWPLYVSIQVRRNFRHIILPFAISMVTLVSIQLTNPANPTLKTFDNHLTGFEKVVAMVKSGEIATSANQVGAEILLPCEYRHLVGCPHRKIRISKEGKTDVIFFCSEMSFWGNRIAGFVYRSDNKDISVNTSGNSGILEVRKLKDNWFWQVEN